MSISINLLPWRDAQRERRTHKFYAVVAGMLVLGVVLGLLVSQFYQLKLAAQYATFFVDLLNVHFQGFKLWVAQKGRRAGH
jgi:type IV pilus assembly protein PilN